MNRSQLNQLMSESIVKTWYSPRGWLAYLLSPLALLYCSIVILRRRLYRLGIFSSTKLAVPVVIVGNVTVGGTGKSPLVIRLADMLQGMGATVGIVSRGYGGKSEQWPRPVNAASDPLQVGDEPVMLAQRTCCPLFVGPDRVAAAQALLQQNEVDILLSDDGLQHYRMQRDYEIVVIDGQRQFGNRMCLPAGPLREPRARLDSVDLLLVQQRRRDMWLEITGVVNVYNPEQRTTLSELKNQPVHAVAGIGNPERFFATLSENDMLLKSTSAFDDHHQFSASDFSFSDGCPVLMTEKDAVKCKLFAKEDWWYIEVKLRLNRDIKAKIQHDMQELLNG